MYRDMGVDYHLLKRRDSKGKPVFYLAVLSDVIGKNGKRKYSAVRSTGAGNEALARKLAQGMLMEGRILASKDTLRDFLISFWDADKSEYLRGKRAEGVQLSSVYCADNQRRIECHFLPWFESRGLTRLSQLDRRLLSSWRNDLFEEEKISPATVNKVRQAVWVALQWAADMEMIPDHPGKAVRRVHEPRFERPFFQFEECNALFSAPWPDPRAYTACLLAYTTGSRMGECRGLQVKNVHLDEGYLDILTNYVAGDGMKAPKWNSIRKDVDLSGIMVRALRDVLSIHPWGALPDQFVFFSTESAARPCDSKLIEKGLFTRLEEIDIPRAGRSFHSFRHTFVSYMRGKVPEVKLTRLVGHTNSTMDDRYTHATDEDRKLMRDAVAGLITGK